MEYLLTTSVILNIVILTLYFAERLKKKSIKDSRDAQELLADLLAGEALVKITRISSTDVFMRSPRGG